MGILSYEKIIKNQKRFVEFEEHLCAFGYIDEDYNFTNKHGLKAVLAENYHDIIQEGYFMPWDSKLMMDIQPLDVRSFQDQWYNVNLDKQFSMCNNLLQYD